MKLTEAEKEENRLLVRKLNLVYKKRKSLKGYIYCFVSKNKDKKPNKRRGLANKIARQHNSAEGRVANCQKCKNRLRCLFPTGKFSFFRWNKIVYEQFEV